MPSGHSRAHNLYASGLRPDGRVTVEIGTDAARKRVNMLLSLEEVTKHSVHAKDAEFGGVEDFLFDDRDWVVRYVVVDTRRWLPGRRVIISPASVSGVDTQSRRLDVSLTREQVERSPALASDAAPSRHLEEKLSHYYSWPIWWNPRASVEAPKLIGLDAPGAVAEPSPPPEPEDSGPVLRSFVKVARYSIAATDGAVGHVKDFLAELPGMAIRYLVVDTGKWLPGRKVLLAPTWIESVRWDESSIHVALERRAIENSPGYEEANPVTRDYELRLFDHYRKPGHWKL